MPPRGRGRQRKPRESRMDAAVDAMKNFGFEEKLIIKTVQELLEVYGGSESWPLIEDSCYSTLLEILLKKNEEGGNEQGEPKNEEGGSLLESGPEGANNQSLVLAHNSDTTPADITEASNHVELSLPEINGHVPKIDIAGIKESSGGDVETTCNNSDVNIKNTNHNLPLPRPTQPPIKNQRRKPCCGWISDDEDDDIIYVKAAANLKPTKSANLNPTKSAKRQSRWDIKPDDI